MAITEPTDHIHVAVACDGNYIMPLAAMLVSLVARLDSQCELVIHVLGTELSQDAWRKLQASLPAKRVSWNHIELQSSLLTDHGFKSRPYEHISSVCFFRLLLPELLPTDLQKVLYLDCDLIICKDITGLWCTDIQDVPLAAVTEWDQDACLASSPAGVRRYQELGMPAEQPLFNAGVLLLNLEHWRRTRLAQRAFNYIREVGGDVRWYEQEALNVVSKGEYREIESHWNVPASIATLLPDEQVSIVHYLAARKPWHWYYDPAQAALFFAALDRTSWSGWRPARPRHGAIRQWGAKLAKAMRKRLYAARGFRSRLTSKLHYWRAMPKQRRLGALNQMPGATGHEIRLFLTAPSVDVDLVQTLNAYFEAGVGRAFVLLDSTAADTASIPARYASFVHEFTCQDNVGGLALRRLLHRYGPSHWCVLGGLCEELVNGVASTVNLIELCAGLDTEGSEVQEATSREVDAIELTGRDVRTNTVFRANACVEQSVFSYDLPVFLSRVVLVKYANHILLDADATLCGNVRKSRRFLHLRRLNRRDEP